MLFLSYSHKDSSILKQLTELLDKEDIAYILDKKDFYLGQGITKSIINNIKHCEAVIILISINSSKSEWVKKEIITAFSLDKVIIPVLYNCNSDEVDFPINLKDVKSINFDDIDTLIFEINRINKDREKTQGNRSFFDEVTHLYYHCNKRGFFKDKNTFSVNKIDVYNFWKDCIYRTNKSWKAISYTKGKETWESDWKRKLITIAQIDRVLSDCQISRAFIVDNNDEYKDILPTIIEQNIMGIEVGHVFKKDVEIIDNKLSEFIDLFGYIKNHDFALVDDEYVFKIEINKNRIVTGASLSIDKHEVKKAKDIITEIYKPRILKKQAKSDTTIINIIDLFQSVISQVNRDKLI